MSLNLNGIVRLVAGLGCCCSVYYIYNYNYGAEDRILRLMEEWESSTKGVEDHKRFCKALRTLIPKGSNDVSKGFLSSVLAFVDNYRASFGNGPEIAEICSSIELRVYSKDDRILRRIEEWEKSNKGVEDHRKLFDALTTELPEGSNFVSKVILSGVQGLGFGIGFGFGLVLGVSLWER